MAWEHVVARENDWKLLTLHEERPNWHKPLGTNGWGPSNLAPWHTSGNGRQTVYFMRLRNGRGERRGRCLNVTSPPIWHLLLQQALQIKNRALESPQDTWPTLIGRRHPRFERPLMMMMTPTSKHMHDHMSRDNVNTLQELMDHRTGSLRTRTML